MKSVAIHSSAMSNLVSFSDAVQTIDLEGVRVLCSLQEIPEPAFDPTSPSAQFSVLVKIHAFSCNYRDKHFILKMATRQDTNGFYVIGSEFVGTVVQVGASVTEFRPGDRVIANAEWPGSGQVTGGLPTNHASKEYLVLDYRKLIKIPDSMNNAVAASFTIGAQTAYSMVRKLALTPGENVLVTAAKSNTSLFAINALRTRGVNIYAVTTSKQFEAELLERGVKQVFCVDPQSDNWIDDPVLGPAARALNGFDAVIDPFFDVHLGKVISLIDFGGRYVTCGLYDQYLGLVGQSFQYHGLPWQTIMLQAMQRNIHIIGNCIGTSQDLQQALADYADGTLDVIIDSTFSGNQVAAFFERTYNARDRLGKVVFEY
jgi:NADPH:quinone reductase-like Zn-dependent oxidoreductase